MGDTNDLQQPGDQDTNIGSTATSPAGQSTDWEARFKGLQREFNTLKKTVDGKDAYNTRVTKEKQALETELAQLSTQYEGQISEIKAQTESVSSEKQTLEQRLAQAEAQLAQREVRDNIRKELTQNHRDVLPWFESGYLQVPNGEDGKPVTGEALTEFITGFRTMLGQQNAQNFQQTFSGSTPPQFNPSGNTPSGMNVQEMDAWLNNPTNINNPERSRVMEAYLTEIEKGQGQVPGLNDSDWLNHI